MDNYIIQICNRATSSALLWFLLITVFSALPTNDGAIVYVRPSSKSTCPDHPCLSFSDYVREKDQYFLDGTSLVFLSGVHNLDLQLQLESVSNISLGPLEGAGSAQIHLSPMVNITCLDSSNVTIAGLEVFLSGLLNNESSFSALIFVSTTSFLSGLSFFGNDSLQSTAIKTQSSIIELSDVTVSGATSLFGAALVVFNSTVNFTGQNYFMNNTATRGGAMYILQSFAYFDGHVYFINNNATTSTFPDPALGGAIYCENSALLFSSSVLFQYNQAIAYFAYGGGIFQQNSTVMFEVQSNVAFIENSAIFSGGAISINSSELMILGRALFEKNFAKSGGGALNGQQNSRILCNNSRERIIFQNNYVDYQNEKISSGGAIFTNLSHLELEGVLFERNVAGSGGAIASKDIYLHILTCDFYNNTALFDGSAITFSGRFAIFNGANNFQWNLANFGGTVSVNFANVTFSGENNFSYNNATNGPGSLYLRSVTRGVICGNLIFYRNYAIRGAGLNGIRSNLRICGNSSFIENSARISGGGMMFFWCDLNITGQVSFLQNSATNSGSAVYIRDSTVMINGRMNISSGTMISSLLLLEGSLGFLNCRVHLSGVLILENNTGDMGGAISARNSKIDILGCIQCINNLAHTSGGALFARNSTVRLRNNSDCNTIFQTNIAAEKGGAIYAVDSTISLSGSQTFLSNSASQGGAIAVDSSSKLVLNQPLQARFIENNAFVGGAIFYEDTFSSIQCTSTISEGNNCFIELDSTSNIQLSFINNTATTAGTVVYGGNFDHCRLYMGGGVSDSCGNRIGGDYSIIIPIAVIEQISESVSVDNVTSNISSDPLQICFCENGIPYCNHKEINIVRGKEFTLMALIVGQNYGVVPSSVRTSLDNDIQISTTQRIQDVGKECTPISYRLSSSKNAITLVLFPDGPCRDARISRREIIINFLPCPDGFTLDGSECVCEERLRKYTTSCNVDDNSIQRASNTFWMGAVYENKTFRGLILHSGCPFDYCIDTPVLIAVDNLDNQCNHNHSGILCGSCLDGYSITFGTLHCLPCSNAYLALILPFALAGIALVAILLLLNISVASGTINGLIFYANVIQVNRSIFFPPETTNILTVFIAWLNLDLGIETCFFDGMNTYIFTWLQFVFPLYVWFLIGLIIVISRFSDKIARSLGKNPVAALATLLHLSYSKILRTIIVALSFTILEYPGNNHQVVWLYDGNIPYFQSASHIVLGTVAIVVLLLLFLPYTLLLLVGHWFQACSDRWIFSWLNKIKPLMDAYHAPYKEESRYWTGLLLFLRCALFLTFAFNTLGNASGNLLAVLSITAGLAILAWLRNRIYENIFNDFLEAAFVLNLCILAAGTYHVNEVRGNQAALTYTSVGIAFLLFVCIMLYHVYLCLHTSALWKKVPKPNSKRYYIFNKVVLLGHNKDDDKDEVEDDERDTPSVQWPTTTSIELRESLLGDSI